MSMQSGLGQPVARAAWFGRHRRYGTIGVLLLGLAASACVSAGQIANLTEGGRDSVAIESIDGAPPAVFHNLARNLTEEATARQIAVVSPGEANYRLRGYLAAHGEGGAASITWALDVYDADRRRAFRLNGEEKTTGRSWTADERLLQRVARSGMDQLALFLATVRAPAVPTSAPASPQRGSLAFGWLDDWAPESAGIFRLLRGTPGQPEMAADTSTPLRPDEVLLPPARPAPSTRPIGGTVASAADD
jgi:hypothetical protein